ncbi:MAG: crotonase/enoyl-CoA hydratase family protein [Myxococcales bacterium]|nr:crotonase/enoyl-CoA hydratase family protein [Myxococcales bacterium]
MDTSPVSYQQEGPVAVIAMDDGKANALSFGMMEALEAALARAEKEARAVVLTGRAGRFSAGFDLREMMGGVERVRSMVTRGVGLLLGLYEFPLPLVVACTGHALAGGALALLTGDVRIGVRGAFKIGLNEVQIGLPTPILAMELARDRLVARHLTAATLFGMTVDPETALTWGYLDLLVDDGELRARALGEAERLAALSRDAYGKTKRALREKTIRYVRSTLAEDLDRLTPTA